MNTLKGQEELDQYKLTRKEVADFLGISTNAVRMAQRGNNCHNLEYRFDGTKYLFKIPRRDQVQSRNPDPLVQHLKTPEVKTPTGMRVGVTPGGTHKTHKKVYNRGSHHEGNDNYPNEAFKMHNEARILNSINKKFKNEAHRRAFDEMNETSLKEALEKSKREENIKFKQEADKSFNKGVPHGVSNTMATSRHQSHGKYGTMLNARGLEEIDIKAQRRENNLDEQKHGMKFKEEYQNVLHFDGSIHRELVKTNEIDFGFGESKFNYPARGYGYDPEDDRGSVEITQEQMYRNKPFVERTDFPTAGGVEESIYRAKLHLLRKKGSWE